MKKTSNCIIQISCQILCKYKTHNGDKKIIFLN